MSRPTELEVLDAPSLRRLATHESERVRGSTLIWSPEDGTYIFNPIQNIMDWTVIKFDRSHIKRHYNPEDEREYWKCRGLEVEVELKNNEIVTVHICLQTIQSKRNHPEWKGMLPDYSFPSPEPGKDYTRCYDCESLRKRMHYKSHRQRLENEAKKLAYMRKRYNMPLELFRQTG